MRPAHEGSQKQRREEPHSCIRLGGLLIFRQKLVESLPTPELTAMADTHLEGVHHQVEEQLLAIFAMWTHAVLCPSSTPVHDWYTGKMES